MAIDSKAQTSRRALLLASVGGAAALVAQALGRPLTARAADGDAMLVGGEYTGDSITQITTAGDITAIGGGSETGAGLLGNAQSGWGVLGTADTGIGVAGTANGNPVVMTTPRRLGRLNARELGLHKLDVTDQGIGVRGESGSGFGIFGLSTGGDHAGVVGISDGAGIGVVGNAPSVGVLGAADENTGVGLYGLGATVSGYALAADGKAAFRRSGKASVLKNKRYVDVDLRTKGGLDQYSLCFAVMQTSRSGTWVRNVRPNYPIAGKMRIYLNKVASTTSSSTVAWIVMD